MASVTKDFHRLLKRVGKLTDGQATILDIDWDEGLLQKFNVIIQPNGGFYKNGKFKFEIKLADTFPDDPPKVWCHTDIYHPNIDPTEECYDDMSTNVCLNVLENGVWSRSFGLEGAILGLLFLMHNPNLQDPLSPYIEGSDSEESFEENVKKYMAGEEFEDMSFDTDFCVKDGILITEQRTVNSESHKDESNNTINGQIEDLKIVNDVISKNETKTTNHDEELNATASGATNELHNETTNEQDRIKEESVVFNEDANISGKDKNTDELDSSATNGKCIDEESGECDIELVNIDGEFVLLINTTTEDENVCSEGTDQTTETTTNDSTSVETNIRDEDKVSTQEGTEIKNETDNLCNEENTAKEHLTLNTGNILPETNNSCNTETTAKIDSYLDVTESDVNTELNNFGNSEGASNEDFEKSRLNDMFPSLKSDIQIYDKQCESDDDSLSNGEKCACGTWYTIRSAISKIVHAVGHNKLYRDIGI